VAEVVLALLVSGSVLVLVGDLALAAVRVSGSARESESDSGQGTAWGQRKKDL